MESKKLAPIVLFVYNRLEHTKATIEALCENERANESQLFIFSDAAQNADNERLVQMVRDYIKTITGFKSIAIIERENNIGLAESIIDGVTRIINEYGRVIVLEDDIVTSPKFLSYMNDALNYYQDRKKVWHISGWNYPIDKGGLEDCFLWRTMNCWGWATWADRWKHFERNVDKTFNEFSKKDIKAFNLDNAYNFWGQVIANKEGRNKTWAIFWGACIFKNRGLCLNPVQTYVFNAGCDGTGQNSGNHSCFSRDLCVKKDIKYIDDLIENKVAYSRIRQFYCKQKISLVLRLINKIKRSLRMWKK